MISISDVITTFHVTQDTLGFWPVMVGSVLSLLGAVTLFSSIYTLIVGSDKTKGSSSSSSSRSNSSSRKRREEIIKNLQTTILKDHATAGGLTLLVGALSRKVEVFSAKLEEVEEYIDNNLIEQLSKVDENIKNLFSSIKAMDGNIDELGAEADTYKDQTNERFRKTHRNFGVIVNKLGDFSVNDYQDFIKSAEEQLRELRGAIFLPEDDEEEDDNVLHPPVDDYTV